MSNTVIKVENLGKKYIIGHQTQEKYTALRDVIANNAKSIARKVINPKSIVKRNTEEFWALKDVSFEIKQGDRIGIIGRNGAGKSTLLKVLSRITEPTKGQIKIKGRVASLLEVGTGFHPELTGRENIFLNGAILGMGKTEIKRKFDEIVSFAEVEQFLDTPVKRYSSGMYVRLAFAVAAHLEPEILVVDEVLAVGDVAFQKKCLGKMEDVAENEGRTVLFVTHNMAAAQALCTKGIVLKRGEIQHIGTIPEAISAYVSTLEKSVKLDLSKRFGINHQKTAWYTGIRFCSNLGKTIETAISGQPLGIVLSYQTYQEEIKLDFYIGIYNFMREKLLHLGNNYSAPMLKNSLQSGEVMCYIPRLTLPEGQYLINLSLYDPNGRLDHITDVIELNVESGDFYNTGKIPPSNENKFLLDHTWKALTDCETHNAVEIG
ncbi:ABC transporter ATP-binding protein [Myxosarcina sp. GI1(2024)]